MISQTIQIWFSALTKPSIETYEQLYNSEEASIGKALLWLIGASLLSTVWSIIGRALLPYHPLNQLNTPATTGSLSAAQAGQVAASMQWMANPWLWLLSGPILFLSMVFVTHVFAQAVGGQGQMGRYSYVIAAIQSPIGLLTALLSWVPIIGQSVGMLISFGFYIFAIVATRAAYKVSTGKAIVAVLLPFVIFSFFIGCIIMFSILPVLMRQ